MMKKTQYGQLVGRRAARSPVIMNTLAAYLVGGGICLFGEALRQLYGMLGLASAEAGLLVTVSLVFLSVALTAVGVYDRIARVAGAGTLVPVTGFANAVASPALDLQAERRVLGIGAGIFTVAGPVLLFGTLSGSLYGVLYLIFGGVL
ncbi:MAG: SpoVA/SpoVAEb family sporulation membrane protein [Clostridia bacterium]|nr:SpoVA/SpoVAEb family sporulation membrane protein [Clostridia bacterium]